MIEFVMLCAMLEGPFQGALPCIPFDTMTQCIEAEGGLVPGFVDFSTCSVMEVFVPNNANSTAPEMSPLPAVKSLRGARLA